MEQVVVVSCARTPMCSFGGKLSSLAASDLGAAAIRAALERGNVKPDQVDEVFMGNVVSAGQGQAPARQAALKAGIPVTCPCTTVNKMCASGMKACMLGAQAILCRQANIVVCGGFESMSKAPFYSMNTRFGQKFGSVQLVDGLQRDGLQDAYTNEAMGSFAALSAAQHGISREEQDQFAANSYARSRLAAQSGKFNFEIAPVELKTRKGTQIVDKDEEIELREVTISTLKSLPSAFTLPKGSPNDLSSLPSSKSITAGNSSVISDGAACVVLASKSFAERFGLPIIATVDGWADAAGKPEDFPSIPAAAMKTALDRSNHSLEEVDLVEINEAFALVPLINMKTLNLPAEKVNIYGGAVSLGHPIGCSGARIICTMIAALHQEKKRVGLLGICNGGGGASAMVISAVPHTNKSVPASL